VQAVALVLAAIARVPVRAVEPPEAAGLEPAPASLDGREIARRAEEVLRGRTVYGCPSRRWTVRWP
jgi:hypothetical protein